MKLGMMLSYADGFKAAAAEAAELEKAGLDVLWVPEAYSFDAVSQLGYLAASTERVQLGSAILPLYSRTPALMAMTAAGLDFVSDGRFILGLGASGPQVIEGFHGVAYDRPVARTREIVDICRRVWRREVLTNDGIYQVPLPPGQGTGLGKALKLINHPVRSEIPIYLASLGEANVELTAEVADGWLPMLYLPERAGHVWGRSLAAGAAQRDPSRAPLEVATGGMVAFVDDPAQARALLDLARPLAALYIGGMGARGRNFYNALACRYGFSAEAARVQELYLAGDRPGAAEAVPDALIEGTNLVGPPAYVGERLAAFAESGVTILNIVPMAAERGERLRLVEQLRTMVDDL
ncbi:MAG TPA: LLM class F420-dependent oxidoreductase [Acidimicrobiales bacterium]|nr:LLM class F420-dependent oxidoreductase [Acidimicrobiales bacterium]